MCAKKPVERLAAIDFNHFMAFSGRPRPSVGLLTAVGHSVIKFVESLSAKYKCFMHKHHHRCT